VTSIRPGVSPSQYIQIVRIFNRMREILASHAELLNKLAKIEEKMGEHDNQIQLIFEYLKQLESARQQELEYKGRKPIGFRSIGSQKD